MSVTVVRYKPSLKNQWDQFVETAKNGLFFFKRDFMEYHKDRFQDHSLVFYKANKIIAVFPANENGKTIFSHQGLSFGGIIFSNTIDFFAGEACFSAMLDYYQSTGFTKLVYKQIPSFYHSVPSFEDEYPLFACNAKLIAKEVNSVISMSGLIKGKRDWDYGIKKSIKENISVNFSNDWVNFWEVLKTVLHQKHNTQPTHSLEDIFYLQEHFPENILLITAKKDDKIISGAVVFFYRTILHIQYQASNSEGTSLRASDALIHFIFHTFPFQYLSFGISNQREKNTINEGLLKWKESFGARTWPHNIYEINLS